MQKKLLIFILVLGFVCGFVLNYTKNNFLSLINPVTLSHMIQAGHYDYVDELITEENFPVNAYKYQNRNLALAGFNNRMSTSEIMGALERSNLQPAGMEDLLAFGAANPYEQFAYPIFALDAVWYDEKGKAFVPGLDSLDKARGLYLTPYSGEWSERCRFLVVIK